MPKFSFFLHCWRVGSVGAASELCRSRVGAASARVGETKKKKRGHSPDTGIRRVVPVPVSDTDTTPKMACPCNVGFSWFGAVEHQSTRSG